MKYSLLLFSVFASLVVYAAVKYPGGIIGTTRLNGEGCTCHNSENDTNVSVWIDGPDSLHLGQSANYKIFLTGGPKVKGGFNVASLLGSLTTVDSLSRKIDVELTHAFPQEFNSKDTISWEFEYTAPNTIGSDTIYSTAMSVNGDEIPSDEDKWNFGNNFVITVITPVKVEGESNLANLGFELMQNYPNPFNPSTKIRYTIPIADSPLLGGARGGLVTLIIYNSLGIEVATLVNDYQSAGSYEVEFQSTVGSRHLASGVYYYKLTFENFSATKKMLLVR